MNPKQIKFCEHYLVHFNGARAAIAAGYSSNSAKEIAYQQLQKPEVQARIAELSAKVADSCLVTINRLLGKLCEIAFDDDRPDQIKAIELLLKRFDNEEVLDADSYEIKHVFEFPHNYRDEPI